MYCVGSVVPLLPRPVVRSIGGSQLIALITCLIDESVLPHPSHTLIYLFYIFPLINVKCTEHVTHLETLLDMSRNDHTLNSSYLQTYLSSLVV